MGKKAAAKMPLAQFHAVCGGKKRSQNVLPSQSQGLSRAMGRGAGTIVRDFGVDGRADECEVWECEDWECEGPNCGQRIAGGEASLEGAGIHVQQQYGAQSCRGLIGSPDLSLLNGHVHAECVFEEMLSREQRYAEHWTVFYHSYSWPALAYEVQAAIASALFKFGAPCGSLPRFLHFPFEGLPDAPTLLSAFSAWSNWDNNPAFKRVAISCATSLFGVDPKVSPSQVFLNGRRGITADFTALEDLIAACGPGLDTSGIKQCVRDLVCLAQAHELPQAVKQASPKGHLLQIFIRRDCVDRFAFASLFDGVPDASRQPLGTSLAKPGLVSGQARLIANPSVFMRASSVRLYAASAHKTFHENRPRFQKAILEVLKPILGNVVARRQAVQGICGAVPQWWTDPVVHHSVVNQTSPSAGAQEDIPLAEAIARSNVTFAEEVVARNSHASQGSAMSAFDANGYVNGRDLSFIVPDSPLSIFRTLKASFGTDMRRLSVSWPAGSSTCLIFESICSVVGESFSDIRTGGVAKTLRLTYVDDEGDECTLVESTVIDFLAIAGHGALKLRVAWLAVLGSDHARNKGVRDLSIGSPVLQNICPNSMVISASLGQSDSAGDVTVEEFSLATPRGADCVDFDSDMKWTSAQDVGIHEASSDGVSEGSTGERDCDSVSAEWADVSGLGHEVESTSFDDFKFI